MKRVESGIATLELPRPLNNFESCKQSNKTRLRLCELKIHMQGPLSQHACSSDASVVLVVLDPRLQRYTLTAKY